NLLENAAKYSPPGGLIRVAAQRGEGRVEVIVEDTGPGLPPGSEEKLFEKFVRGRSEDAVTGVGLGLAICRAIVEAHGGTIRAENIVADAKDEQRVLGARFVFGLPLGEPPPVEEGPGEETT